MHKFHSLECICLLNTKCLLGWSYTLSCIDYMIHWCKFHSVQYIRKSTRSTHHMELNFHHRTVRLIGLRHPRKPPHSCLSHLQKVGMGKHMNCYSELAHSRLSNLNNSNLRPQSKFSMKDGNLNKCLRLLCRMSNCINIHYPTIKRLRRMQCKNRSRYIPNRVLSTIGK